LVIYDEKLELINNVLYIIFNQMQLRNFINKRKTSVEVYV